MNTLTQQQINQYQWQVTDGVAIIVNPYVGYVFAEEDKGYIFEQNQLFEKFDEFAKQHQFQTNAPDGIYSGEAFELTYRLKAKEHYVNQDGFSQYRAWIFISKGQFEYANDRFYDVQTFLRLKPSHLPAILTTQQGVEWKDRYSEVWLESFNGGAFRKKPPISMRYFKDFDVYVKSLGTAFKAKREWHLNTPPAEQEAGTVVKDASYYEILSNVPGRQQEGINIALLKIWGEVEKWYGDPKKQESGRELLLRLQKEFNINFANRKPNHFETIDQLQSTLTQKDQRIAELEREWISVNEFDESTLPIVGKSVIGIVDYITSRKEARDYIVCYMGEEKETRLLADDDYYGWDFDECIVQWTYLDMPLPPIF